MKIAIATDTNSGISGNAAQEKGVYSLPMPVIIDGKFFLEGLDITNAQQYQAMREERDISTSQPSPGQLLDFWDDILAEGYDEIVYIPMSSGLSNSCHSAAQFAKDYNGKVQVVDNHRISVTQAASVMSACRLREQGMDAAKIREILEEHAYDASIYLTVDSFEYLKKGGRITSTAAAFATVLNLKPILTIQGNKIDAFAKARGMKQAEVKMIEAIQKDWETRFSDVPADALQIETAGTFENSADAERWRSAVQQAFPAFRVSYVDLPCSIASHVGINAAGAGILKR